MPDSLEPVSQQPAQTIAQTKEQLAAAMNRGDRPAAVALQTQLHKLQQQAKGK